MLFFYAVWCKGREPHLSVELLLSLHPFYAEEKYSRSRVACFWMLEVLREIPWASCCDLQAYVCVSKPLRDGAKMVYRKKRDRRAQIIKKGKLRHLVSNRAVCLHDYFCTIRNPRALFFSAV